MQNLNIVIPCAGRGNRFIEQGCKLPKLLIPIFGKPMIQWVVESINIKANYIFLCQKEHIEKYNLIHLLRLISPQCTIVPVDGVTEGAACTLMLAKTNIYNDNPLLIANSDQFIEWDSSHFMYLMNNSYDGSILVFNATETKWSYVRTENDYIIEVAEKKVISNLATVGVYYFKRGMDCCQAIEEMISKNIRTNGEFYIAPCYNELIAKGKKIIPYPVKKMWGLGVPKDLEYFINNYARQ